MTSYRYTSAYCHLTLDRSISTALWKVAGAFFNPRGIRTNRNNPMWDVKVVLSLSASSTSTHQYPLL